MAKLIGNEVPQTVDSTTQVYKATHEGTARLSLRNRSFISFSFGGRAIEDFNLLVTTQDRLQRAAYGEFEDITSEYDVLDGQFYWGTYMKKNTIEFNLTTDAITEQELNEFKHWFKPGVIRKLILAENPNRAIWARVSTSPAFSLVPMEKVVTKKINGMDYSTSTTSYRGDVGISFIMDDPYWFSVNSILKTYYTNPEDKFGSMTDEYIEGAIESLTDKDIIKSIIEDGTPCSSMIKNKNIIFGDKSVETKLSDKSPAYLYYCGTANGRPLVKITLTPGFKQDFLTWPQNSYSHFVLSGDEINSYNILKIGDREFRFSAPALFLGYNQGIEIIKNMIIGESVEDARRALRDNVYEYHSRNWCLFCLETMIQNQWGVNSAGAFTNGFRDYFVQCMRFFLTMKGEESQILPVTLSIDSKTGKATGRFEFRVPNLEINLPTSMDDFIPQSAIVLEENIEDMIKSDYPLIETRNFPNENGEITENECTVITTDYPEDECGQITVNIQYENEYL